jgi:hypothetical protein
MNLVLENVRNAGITSKSSAKPGPYEVNPKQRTDVIGKLEYEVEEVFFLKCRTKLKGGNLPWRR